MAYREKLKCCYFDLAITLIFIEITVKTIDSMSLWQTKITVNVHKIFISMTSFPQRQAQLHSWIRKLEAQSKYLLWKFLLYFIKSAKIQHLEVGYQKYNSRLWSEQK